MEPTPSPSVGLPVRKPEGLIFGTVERIFCKNMGSFMVRSETVTVPRQILGPPHEHGSISILKLPLSTLSAFIEAKLLIRFDLTASLIQNASYFALGEGGTRLKLHWRCFY